MHRWGGRSRRPSSTRCTSAGSPGNGQEKYQVADVNHEQHGRNRQAEPDQFLRAGLNDVAKGTREIAAISSMAA